MEATLKHSGCRPAPPKLTASTARLLLSDPSAPCLFPSPSSRAYIALKTLPAVVVLSFYLHYSTFAFHSFTLPSFVQADSHSLLTRFDIVFTSTTQPPFNYSLLDSLDRISRPKQQCSSQQPLWLWPLWPLARHLPPSRPAGTTTIIPTSMLLVPTGKRYSSITETPTNTHQLDRKAWSRRP